MGTTGFDTGLLAVTELDYVELLFCFAAVSSHFLVRHSRAQWRYFAVPAAAALGGISLSVLWGSHDKGYTENTTTGT